MLSEYLLGLKKHELKFFIAIFISLIAYDNSLGQVYDVGPTNGYFTMEIVGNPGRANQTETNVTILKVIDPSNGRLQYRYDIITPPVDDFHFVLALDSSSSLKASYNSEQSNAIIKAVPNFIRDAANEHKDKMFKISIVSWDDNIDFASSPFGNNISDNAKLKKINNVSEDIETYNVFGEVNDSRYYYCSFDEDGTNLSKPLEAAIRILDNNPPIRYHRTSNFTIIVVGEGEYKKCMDTYINDAQEKGYAVYTILLGYSETSDLLLHLQNITGNKSRVFTCIPSDKALEKELEIQLKKALEKALSEPAAEDVILYDRFNGFIPPGNKGSIEVIGYPQTHQEITLNIVNNSTSIRIPNGLWANNLTRVTLDASIDFKNMAVSANKNPFSSLENNSIMEPNLSYLWLREQNRFNVKIPDNSSINIIGPILESSIQTAGEPRGSARNWLLNIGFTLSKVLRI